MRFAKTKWLHTASGLVLMLQIGACDGADRPLTAAADAASAAASAATRIEPPAPSETVLGSWARQASECQRPELVFKAASVTIQTDADGRDVRFAYEAASYFDDGSGQVTVKLGKPHPYGKTSSKTALTFRVDSANQIALAQANRFVPFQRCGKAHP